METDETPTDNARTTESRWPQGCAVALIVLVVLGSLGLWGLHEVEKGLDGYGQLEGGASYSPLTPGTTARYEDGLKVTVSVPRREPDGRTYSFTVTYENGTDRPLTPGDTSADASVSTYAHGSAPLVVRAGQRYDDDTRLDDIDWLNYLEAGEKLLPPLAEDESVTVPVRVTGSRKGMPVTVEVTPPDAGYRETASWELTLG
ncbi:hypothetical protein QWM81_13255 [Streptomyces ficellus]|uniref:DUF4352 domain-containing protein n=1 Tax=Streptomyces ficellus TaxID=1977088 RepID=A0ABT7Z7F3_9ACTN|nr:hypothetical protein [Streptomyces ficellus]MDN3295001.1 hypothetical protein [Streptomyces ficellus]